MRTLCCDAEIEYSTICGAVIATCPLCYDYDSPIGQGKTREEAAENLTWAIDSGVWAELYVWAELCEDYL